MLTSQQARQYFKALIVLTSIIITFQLGGAATMVISKYYGFAGSSPFTCTSASLYWIPKYKLNDYEFSISFIGIISSFLGTLAALLIVIKQLLALSSLSGEDETTKSHQIIQTTTIVLYILIAFAFLTVLVPLGWFSTLIIEIKSACDITVQLYWLIIAGAAGLSEILLLVCLILVAKTRNSIQEEKKQEQNNKNQTNKKQDQNIVKQIEGDLGNNKEQQQKTPLLQKQRVEETMPAQGNTQNQSPQIQNNRFRTEQRQPQPIEASYHRTNKQEQLPRSAQIMKQPKQITQGIQTEPMKNYSRSYSNQVHKEPYEQKEIKVQKVRSDTPQSVSITLNLPNGYPTGQQPQLANSSSSDNIRKKSNSKRMLKKQKREVIKESMQEQLSSDSDDHYYKRARKTNRKKVPYDQSQNGKNKKRKNKEDYQQDFDQISSRFKDNPSEPKYVILSPQSMRNFHDFMKNDHQNANKKSHRNFVYGHQDDHTPQHQKKQFKKRHAKDNVSKPIQKQEKLTKDYLLRPNSFVVSQVKQYKGSQYQNPKRQQGKQRSIYEKLDGHDSDNGLKKYQAFFKSSQTLKKQQHINQNKNQYEDYFNVLNKSSTENKDLPNAIAQNYKSISNNYSSVLHNQGNGKMPTQRESHHKINLEENKIRSKGKTKQKNNLIDQIRSKYA